MLHIHRAERADRLVAALAELLSEPLADPFAPEVVAVPTRGMERWLSQQLSGHLGTSPDRSDGVCANVEFPSPWRLAADALATASGVDPDSDPWFPERATWPLLETIDAHLEAPWLRSLAAYLGHGDDELDPVKQSRRLSASRHLAELFYRYGIHRPAMVCAWAAGEDGDGEGRPLPARASWQAMLWRALRGRVAMPSPAERLEPACARLAADSSLLALPSRLSLFGLTRLPAGTLAILRAVATQRDVHLFLLHPSPALWDRLAGQRPPGLLRRSEDLTAELPDNPLLSSWGRDAREMQLTLQSQAEPAIDRHHPSPAGTTSLLERLQAGVRADEAPPAAELDPADRSVQIHACHGRSRQVEVLRDAVLQLLAADPTLEPRDVIVMCPDIEAFAPLIEATFGAGEVDTDADTVDLRVRLADRSLRQTNPVLSALAELLELASQRVTASQVLSFADREPVRRRFGLRDADLSRLQRWIAEAGIRWGLDAAHRAPFRLEDLASGTWRAGLDRLLLGVTMSEDGSRLFQRVLPLDDIDSGSIELAGRVAELLARLGEAIDALATAKPIDAWAATLGWAADALTATAPREAWQRAELQRLLDDLCAEAASATTPALTLTELRALLAERLAGRPTRANFRTGHLTVCTLYPMRSVPHRVVCLLGLDDGAFPRKAPRDGDDLMLDDPRVGERDPRSEDRQLLLDALMAAREHLVITYTGNDERTNLPRPPAVPVGELLDVIDATAGGEARRQVLVRHPLQPFDWRNFARGELVPDTPFSFDRVALAGARAQRGRRQPIPAFLTRKLEPLDESMVALEDLVRFVQHPVRAFLRRRLRISLAEVTDEVSDVLPVELDQLERWDVGQRLLESRLAGVSGNAAIKAEIARGTLPPGVLGEPVVRELYPVVDGIVTTAHDLAPGEPDPAPLDIQVPLLGGRVLTGTVSGLRGERILSVLYSRLAPKHRLASWVRLLAATAAHPDRPLCAAAVGRPSRGAADSMVATAVIPPLGEDAATRRASALAQLESLVDLYDRGMREPLPLFCATSAAYAWAAATGGDPHAAAAEEWESRYRFPREDQELEHQLVLGGCRTLDEVLGQVPTADERFHPEETTRFGHLARRLWEGLLAVEQLSMR